MHFPLGVQWDAPQYRNNTMQKKAASDIEFIVKWFLRLSISENSLLLKNAEYNEVYSSFMRRCDKYLSNQTWAKHDEVSNCQEAMIGEAIREEIERVPMSAHDKETLREEERGEHECMHTSAHDKSINTAGHEIVIETAQENFTMEEAKYPEYEESMSCVYESVSIAEEKAEDNINNDSPIEDGLMDEVSMNGSDHNTSRVKTFHALTNTLPKKVEEFAKRMKEFREELLKHDPTSVNPQQLESLCLQAYEKYVSSFMIDLDHTIVSSLLRFHSHGTNQEEYGTFTKLRTNPFGLNVSFPQNQDSEALLMTTMEKVAEKVQIEASKDMQWLTKLSAESGMLGELAVT